MAVENLPYADASSSPRKTIALGEGSRAVALIAPEAPAPTKGQVANVLRIRDELAHVIAKARTPPEYGGNRPDKVSAALSLAVAERLIEAGFIDFEAIHSAIHRAIIEGMHDGDDKAEDEEDFLLDL